MSFRGRSPWESPAKQLILAEDQLTWYICSMLIGVYGIDTSVMEIATARWASQ